MKLMDLDVFSERWTFLEGECDIQESTWRKQDHDMYKKNETLEKKVKEKTTKGFFKQISETYQ